MPSEISVLLRVQELDQRIGELTSEIDNLPRHVASIKARLAAHRQALERTQAILAENGKDVATWRAKSAITSRRSRSCRTR